MSLVAEDFFLVGSSLFTDGCSADSSDSDVLVRGEVSSGSFCSAVFLFHSVLPQAEILNSPEKSW